MMQPIIRQIMLACAAVLAGVVCCCANELPEKDIPGARDYPLVIRSSGSVITRYETRGRGVYALALGPMVAKRPEKVQRLRGSIIRITYKSAELWSTTETFDHYRDALLSAGFTPLFTAEGRDLSKYNEWPNYLYQGIYALEGETRHQRYFAARQDLPGGTRYATLYVSLGWYTRAVAQLDIIETRTRK